MAPSSNSFIPQLMCPLSTSRFDAGLHLSPPLPLDGPVIQDMPVSALNAGGHLSPPLLHGVQPPQGDDPAIPHVESRAPFANLNVLPVVLSNNICVDVDDGVDWFALRGFGHPVHNLFNASCCLAGKTWYYFPSRNIVATSLATASNRCFSSTQKIDRVLSVTMEDVVARIQSSRGKKDLQNQAYRGSASATEQLQRRTTATAQRAAHREALMEDQAASVR
ncbi:hypothetical protein C8J57DRAFT_1239940 [Mycena rebaudengoi]|nr:hypothetical protein C8J57DRAFT_1239940 [Mycena rebaudengoi]